MDGESVIANLQASMEYIKARYGSPENAREACPDLPPQGYAAGGLLPVIEATFSNYKETVFDEQQLKAAFDKLDKETNE